MDTHNRYGLTRSESTMVAVKQANRHFAETFKPVSYTHLDVYKRQHYNNLQHFLDVM